MKVEEMRISKKSYLLKPTQTIVPCWFSSIGSAGSGSYWYWLYSQIPPWETHDSVSSYRVLVFASFHAADNELCHTFVSG